MSRILPLTCLLLAACAAAEPLATVEGPTFYVTSADESGAGSLREAIEKANESTVPSRIVSHLQPGTVVRVTRALPALAGSDIEFDADGLVLESGTCVRPDGKAGCSGLLIRGPGTTVRRLVVQGFLFDGITVLGREAVGVVISHCTSRDNLDDGIGISAWASNVLVEACELTGNGFRTKGKGVLVFDNAKAVLRANRIQGNRDGVTVTKFAHARLESNVIEHNYDKGLGVSAGNVRGSGNRIANNGLSGADGRRPPNGDGLRVGLTSSVRLEDTVIEGNGDAGVVVMNDSEVVLVGGVIAGNGGVAVSARDTARLALHGVSVRENAGGEAELFGRASLTRVP